MSQDHKFNKNQILILCIINKNHVYGQVPINEGHKSTVSRNNEYFYFIVFSHAFVRSVGENQVFLDEKTDTAVTFFS